MRNIYFIMTCIKFTKEAGKISVCVIYFYINLDKGLYLFSN